MTEQERRSEIAKRAWLTREAGRAVRRRMSDVRFSSCRRREAWIQKWFERHRSELMHEDEEISNRSWLALQVIWRFAADMAWLRDNIEYLHEDDRTTNSLLEALHVIWRYAAGMGIPVQVIKTTYEPCVPPIRRMQL